MALGRCEANSSQIKVAIWHKKDGASVRRSALLGGDGGVKLRPAAQQCVRLLYRPDGRRSQGDCWVGAEDRVDGESGCWREDHTGAYGRTGTVARPELPSR